MFVFPVTFYAAAAAAVASSTWNPSDKNSHLILSNNNLTFTNDGLGGTESAIRSIKSNSTGKKYFECHVGTNSGLLAVGIAKGSASLSTCPGGGASSDSYGIHLGSTNNGLSFINGGGIIVGPSFSTGDFGGVAVDLDAKLIWWRNNNAPTVWNQGGSADPATGVGGVSYAALSGSTFFVEGGARDSDNNSLTINMNGAGFNGSIPAGFSAWG